jgi:E3 ubiquitin-protein ligase ZNRF1/2
MGAKQSSNTSPSRLIQSNGSNVSANGHHSHHNNNGLIGVMPSTSMSTNGSSRTNSTRLNATNTDINTTNDWRQRTRSLSSVLSGQQTNGSAIHVSQLNSFGLSASPDSDTSTEDNLPFGRVFSAHSLPVQLISFNGIKCPVCSKFVLPDDVECHLVMCLTKPRINYNEDMLTEDKGECVICLEELIQGNTIARLPCLCIYHKSCIDAWFEVNRSCPEHPSD